MDYNFVNFFGLGLTLMVSKFAGLDLGLGLGKIIGFRSRSQHLWSRLHDWIW